MPDSNRREFLKHTGQTAAVTAAMAITHQARAAAANDVPVVALIGTGGMGNGHLELLSRNDGIRLAYLCDVDERRLADGVKRAHGNSGHTPKAVKDMRKIFDDPSVDAVWIATPDHWHAPAAILAADAGKHVYVEKPCSHNIREGRLMIEAARRNKRVMQVGTQSRSTRHIRQAVDRLREGAIGEVLVAKAWNSQLRSNIGHQKPTAPPDYLDYDLWLGPVPPVPYQSNMLPNVWRWWYAFGGGDMGNDGVHDIDIALWGLGADEHPSTISALGGKYYFDDDQQFPDTQYVVFEYAAKGEKGRKKQLVYEQRIWSPYVQEGHENGNAFYGTKGMLLLGKKEGYVLTGPRNKIKEKVKGSGPDLAAHHRNFLECIKTGEQPHADIAINHLSSSLCHLGNIATRTSRVIHFDPAAEKIVGDEDAAKLVHRSYRDGHWAAPKNV